MPIPFTKYVRPFWTAERQSLNELNCSTRVAAKISMLHQVYQPRPTRRATERRYRVLLVSSSSGSRGGGETYLTGLAEGLTALGHEVTAVMASHPRMDDLAQQLSVFGQVRRIPYTNTYDRVLRSGGAALCGWLSRGLARTLAETVPDIIHLNRQNVEDALDLLIAMRRVRIPTVATVHITRSMAQLGGIGGALRDRVARYVQRRSTCHWITIAATCAEQFKSYLGDTVNGDRLHCIPNGVAAAPTADRAAIRKEWGCRDDDLVLGCVARLEAQKNPLFMIELLRRLPARVRLVWVGDGSLRDELTRAAEAAGVRDRVHCDGWRADARQRMAGFDVFVLPSLFEGFPLAILEAMAAGLPSVVSDVDANREAVEPGSTGYLCPVGQPEPWVQSLTALLADPELRTRMGTRAQLHHEERFSLEAMATATAEVYTRAMTE